MQIKNILLFSILLLSSCMVGPDYKRPQFFPTADVKSSLQLSGTEKPVSLEWYKQFNDPVLNSLIARGLEYSPTVEAARQKLVQSRQNLRINLVQNFPTLDAAGTYNKSKVSKNYSTLQPQDDYYQAAVDSAWELDIWGGGRRLTESSLAMVKAAGANLENVRLVLTAEIAGNYISLRQAQEQLRLAQNNLRLQEDIYNLVKRKYTAGLTDSVALNQAEYLLSTTKQQIPALAIQVESYKNSLAILTGRLAGLLDETLSDPEHNLTAQKYVFDTQKLYDLPISVLRNRPDIRVLENQLISQNAQIGRAVAEIFPSVSLSSFVGYRSRSSGNLISSGSSAYAFAPSVNLPLFRWGALYNNIELQKSLTKEQLQLYKSGLLEASAEIRNAIVSLRRNQENNQSARQAQTAQAQVADLTLRKYREGLLSFSEVLTSQQNLLNSQNTLVASNAAVYQNIIAFYKAIGGGYSNHLDQKCASLL